MSIRVEELTKRYAGHPVVNGVSLEVSNGELFGALEAEVRSELRRTVRDVQRELDITTLFVTLDQEEAFEPADRLGVLSYRRLLEVGPPEELHLRPPNSPHLACPRRLPTWVGDAPSRCAILEFVITLNTFS